MAVEKQAQRSTINVGAIPLSTRINYPPPPRVLRALHPYFMFRLTFGDQEPITNLVWILSTNIESWPQALLNPKYIIISKSMLT